MRKIFFVHFNQYLNPKKKVHVFQIVMNTKYQQLIKLFQITICTLLQKKKNKMNKLKTFQM